MNLTAGILHELLVYMTPFQIRLLTWLVILIVSAVAVALGSSAVLGFLDLCERLSGMLAGP